MTKLLYSDCLEQIRQREQHLREDVRLQAEVDTSMLKLRLDAESPSYGRDLGHSVQRHARKNEPD